MDETKVELNELFAPNSTGLQPEIIGELLSILRLHSISPQELFYKWESYSMKMGGDELKLDLKTARDLKKDIQDALERESRGKAHGRAQEKRVAHTPRAAVNSSDMFGMLDSLVPGTPTGANAKRKSNFDTPTAKFNKSHAMSSPGDFRPTQAAIGNNGVRAINFADRPNAGDIYECVNAHIEHPEEAEEPPAEPRIKIKLNTEVSKFAYKTMAMKLSEASEILDDRIDEFIPLIQAHHNLDDGIFGNPSIQGTSEIVAVGRIASDSSAGRLNAASLVLETSRRGGAGLRVPLRVDSLNDYRFFPGQIVAVRGQNASGEFFTVNEVLSIPQLGFPANPASELENFNSRFLFSPASGDSPRPLTILVAAGPYITDSDLDFSPLHALLEKAVAISADSLILFGPFIDAEHPIIRTGDFDIPPSANSNPDTQTLNDVFRHFISTPLARFNSSLPTCTTVLIPSLRDTISKHAAWPQDRLNIAAKREIGIPKQIQVCTNPCTFSLNEILFGTTSLDILDMIRREECVGGLSKTMNVMERAVRGVLDQRSFCPLFPPTARESLPVPPPATGDGEAIKGEGEDGEEGAPDPFLPLGAMVDTSYMRLGEWTGAQPDVLVTPSVLTPFVKIIEGVLAINPGTLAKRKGFGTYARMTVLPAQISEQESSGNQSVGHKLFERARVDIVKI